MTLVKKCSSLMPIKEGNTVIFYLNTGGFPLASDAWSHMFDYAKELQPSAARLVESIKEKSISDLPNVEIPEAPYEFINSKKNTNIEKLEKIQSFIDSLQYNHIGLQFFEIRKDRPIIGLAEVAKKIINHSLPIKCLEAVVLSIYLINEITPIANSMGSGVEKFSIGFKTVSSGHVHRHVVLGVYCHTTGLFGALGLSRRTDLSFKPVKFKTLTDLILNYIESYSTYLHRVKRIRIGMPIPDSNRSFETIQWNGCSINISQSEASEWPKLVEKQSKNIRHSNYNFNLAQSTSLSFKNITNLTSNRNYLKQHLDKNASNRIRSKSHDHGTLKLLDRKKILREEIENFEEDEDDFDEDEDEFYSNCFFNNTTPLSGESLTQVKLRKKNFDFGHQSNNTGLNLKHVTDNRLSLQINQLSNDNTILTKRKKNH